MESFQLDPRLNESSLFVDHLQLCQVRLHKNRLFPWALLIPQRANVSELTDLNKEDQLLLMDEITLMSKVMQDIYKPDKMNVATLGNIVPQLHIHVIARYKNDQAWPNPIWNSGHEKMGSEEELRASIIHLKSKLSQLHIRS